MAYPTGLATFELKTFQLTRVMYAFGERWGAGIPLGTSEFDSSGGLGFDNNGNVFSHSISSPSDIIDIRKFGPAGNQIWQKSLMINGANLGETSVDGAGNVYMAGNFSGTVDFDPSNKTRLVSSGPTFSNGGTAFVMSLDPNGNFRWVSPFKALADSTGSYGFAQASGLKIDSSGGLYVGGTYSRLIDFQVTSQVVTLPTSRGGGAYVAKLSSSNGQLTWAKALEGRAGAYDVDVDSLGNVYATGYFRDAGFDLDPTAGTDFRSSMGDQDIFVVKFNSDGALSWAETLGAAGVDVAMGIAIDGNGYVHTAGYIMGTTTDFDPDPLGSSELTAGVNKSKAFRLKLKQA